MAATQKDRAARERLRAYQARQTVHDATISRHRRDNVLSLLILDGVAALAATALVL